jgi:hypothetical protein
MSDEPRNERDDLEKLNPFRMVEQAIEVARKLPPEERARLAKLNEGSWPPRKLVGGFHRRDTEES